MVERTISAIGMCMKECTRSEGIRLQNNESLVVNTCLSGNVCIAAGAMAARYTFEELKAIGHGNDQVGIIEVAKDIRTRPDVMVYGALRPCDSLAVE